MIPGRDLPNQVGLFGPYLSPGSSFVSFVRDVAPDLLPEPFTHHKAETFPAAKAPHGTTILAVRYDGGTVMAGDRRATMGNVIASRTIEKVFPADSSSAIGIAGAAGIGLELVRLFTMELEHYEKIEGMPLSLEGKANRLATLLRGNLSMAMQGLAALPLLAGFDSKTQTGQIFSYDVTGGRYEEKDYHAIGSGAVYASSSLKASWRPGVDEDRAIRLALSSLLDASDDDSATGGPDIRRSTYPVIAVVDAGGYRRVGDAEMTLLLQNILAEKDGEQ